jgi:hypothetical protein
MGRNLKAAYFLMFVEDHQRFARSEYAVSHDNVFGLKNPAVAKQGPYEDREHLSMHVADNKTSETLAAAMHERNR